MRIKNRSIKMIVSTMLIVAMLGISACGQSFDASGYVKSTLDAITRAEFDKYVELTESTKEEAQAEYDDMIDMFTAEFESFNISDELNAKFGQLFVDLLASTKYTVGEAQKDGDNFTVSLTVEPIDLYDGFDEEIEEAAVAFQEELLAEIELTGEVPSEEEVMERSIELSYDILKARVDAPTYKEAQSITVTVAKDADGLYSISESDLEDIVELLVLQQ